MLAPIGLPAPPNAKSPQVPATVSVRVLMVQLMLNGDVLPMVSTPVSVRMLPFTVIVPVSEKGCGPVATIEKPPSPLKVKVKVSPLASVPEKFGLDCADAARSNAAISVAIIRQQA